MDWIRLGNSGVDLTGVGGIPRTVTLTELANHNKQNDAWIAIRGTKCCTNARQPIFICKYQNLVNFIPLTAFLSFPGSTFNLGIVFNVTRYMDFHPGGIDELMKGVGKDATKLFDNVRPS